jgi:hypothetical protein
MNKTTPTANNGSAIVAADRICSESCRQTPAEAALRVGCERVDGVVDLVEVGPTGERDGDGV